jgi:hypothetical protein
MQCPPCASHPFRQEYTEGNSQAYNTTDLPLMLDMDAFASTLVLFQLDHMDACMLAGALAIVPLPQSTEFMTLVRIKLVRAYAEGMEAALSLKGDQGLTQDASFRLSSTRAAAGCLSTTGGKRTSLMSSKSLCMSATSESDR